MKLDWKLYFTVLGIAALLMVAYEMNAFALWSDSESNPDVVRVENAEQYASELSASSDDKKEILDGEFTVLNNSQSLKSGDVIKNEEQADTGIVPTHIKIPSIEVDAPLGAVGVLDNGEMGVPESPQKAGWFEPGTQPGNVGNAVIAGHVDSRTGPAVFYDLKKLKKGDEITVKNDEGEAKTYVVEKLESYPMEESPITQIFGKTDEKRLNLITCTGEFVRDRGGHQDRLVVYSTLKEPVPEKEEIDAPANVSVQGTFITWHAVREDYVAGYRVYRSKDGESFEKVASISRHERKSYADPEASEFQYYVTTVGESGQESEPSPIAEE
ncbi:class F sortase [Halobacillus litoralis]|uniref:Class F sortase n=1 Tax=Halobacillus litoralis TaxID=45668 RepID=A0A410ME52_9BACI|nr:class F sortase [Halobacillus litoralis]QAS52993.1 class F sortase [Halobacillus litoralis]